SNVLGATICLWGTNNLGDRLITLYAGADYLWTPQTPVREGWDHYGEDLRFRFERHMRNWQIVFADAGPAMLERDRGPEVFLGRYLWPPMAGQAVAPTIDFRPQLP
ncbi:hypothetical protein JW992_07855, partial [candidate division KSB1 bacterium]|nr:hypothetical protein [candidate division KSB1 bacterium]